MPETRNIVILGASYGGLGSAHYFLRHIFPKLPQDDKFVYQAVLVDPSSKFYMRPASPRGVASAELMPEKALFHDLQSALEQYGDKVRFFQGSATSWSVEDRVVTISKPDGKKVTLPYHALILATGTKASSPLFSQQGTAHTEIQEALHAVHKQLTNAKRIVIVGGGATGVETSGEIGELLNGTPGWFCSRPSNPKAEVTLVTSSSRLLPNLRPSIGAQAEVYLNRVGVDVQYKTKLTSTKTLDNGRTEITLDNGESITADLYIPAMGTTPMSSYVPPHLLDDKGYIHTNAKTTRVDNAGPRVYAVGDVATYSDNGILAINDSIPVLETNLQRDLLAAHRDTDAKPTGPDREYKPNLKETQIVPVGQSKGVGAVFGWRVPSWFVWLVKGRDYMAPRGVDFVMGKQWAKESSWKPPQV